MSFPTPKYKIGDTVWRATQVESSRALDCPDCLGQRKWTVKTPAGEEHEIPCQRCGSSYSHQFLPPIREYEPRVQRLTIGSIRIDTNSKEPVEYMCAETGIGSGSIHHESRLFPDEQAAMAAAALMVAEQNHKIIELPGIQKVLKESHIRIGSLEAERERERRYAAERFGEDLVEAIHRLCDAHGLTDLSEFHQELIDAEYTFEKEDVLRTWLKKSGVQLP